MDLSTNFQFKEFTSVPLNEIPQIQVFMLKNLTINLLEPIRDFLRCSIEITCGIRTMEDVKRLIAKGYHPSESSDHYFGSAFPLNNPKKIQIYGKEYAYSVGAADVVPACGAKIAFEKLRPYFKSNTNEIWLPSKMLKVGQLILEKGNDYWLHISNPATILYEKSFVERYLKRRPFLISLDNGESYQPVV